MIAEDGASGNVETGFWPYGKGFGIQIAADGQIEPDFSLPGHTSHSDIPCAAPSITRHSPFGLSTMSVNPAEGGFPDRGCSRFQAADWFERMPMDAEVVNAGLKIQRWPE